jgi:hypothetical protein
MVNLMRVLGSCLGVSAASSMMSWWLQQRGGHDSLDVLFSGHTLLDAIESSLAVLVVFAVAAALLSWLRLPAPRSVGPSPPARRSRAP